MSVCKSLAKFAGKHFLRSRFLPAVSWPETSLQKDTSKGTFFLKTFTEHLQISTPRDSSVPTMFYSLSTLYSIFPSFFLLVILEFVQKVYENEEFNIFFNIYMNAFKTILPLQ